LPESAHKNDNGDCEDDWEVAYVIKKELDIRIPSIGLLSDNIHSAVNSGDTRFKLFIISVRSAFKARNCWFFTSNCCYAADLVFASVKNFTRGHNNPQIKDKLKHHLGSFKENDERSRIQRQVSGLLLASFFP
jgi:hypothetical protein